MSWLLFLNIVGVGTVNLEALDQLDVVHAAYQMILAVSHATSEPKHAYQCINRCKEEEEFAQFHQTNAYLQIIILDKLQSLVELLLLEHVSFLLGVQISRIFLFSWCRCSWGELSSWLAGISSLGHFHLLVVDNFLTSFSYHQS